MKSCSGVTEIQAGVRQERLEQHRLQCLVIWMFFLLLAFTTFSSTAMADIAWFYAIEYLRLALSLTKHNTKLIAQKLILNYRHFAFHVVRSVWLVCCFDFWSDGGDGRPAVNTEGETVQFT